MRKVLIVSLFAFLATCFAGDLFGQGYQALHGSAYAGSTAVFNNPAAAVHSAYKWDLTLFATQAKLSTNSAFLDQSDPNNTGLVFRDGHFSRHLHANVDMNLVNVLYKIDNWKAVNFSLRARAYVHTKTLPFNFVDSTIDNFKSFLVANRNTSFLEGFATHAGWLEGAFTYAQVLAEDNYSKLSAGITLQVMKDLSGGFLKATKIGYAEDKDGTDTSYRFTNGRGSFAYSANYDDAGNMKDFINRSATSFGISIGAEYLVYNSDHTEGINNNLNYDWKIGVSLMDFGKHSFTASTNSRRGTQPNSNITETQVENKVSGAQNMQELSDSIATLFTGSSTITDAFSVSSPTRLIVNVDRRLGNNFYVNGEISMNFFSTSSQKKLYTRELNLLTVTPRWETIGFGAYLPVQYNTQGQFWIGAAVKLGPLVAGIHNLGWLKKSPNVSGGAYLLLSVHPFSKKKVVSKMDCL